MVYLQEAARLSTRDADVAATVGHAKSNSTTERKGLVGQCNLLAWNFYGTEFLVQLIPHHLMHLTLSSLGFTDKAESVKYLPRL